MPLEHHRTPVNGITVAWTASTQEEAPKHVPIAILHGLGSSSREFTYLADLPGFVDHRLILIDIPGFGNSDKPSDWTYAMENQADVLAVLLHRIVTGPVALAGHSMGGSIAIALATRYPDLVERLILAEPNLDPGSGMLSGHIARQPEATFLSRGMRRLLYQTGREAARGDLVASRFLVSLEQASPIALHRSAVSLRADRAPTFRQQLEALQIPRTLLWGERTPPLDPPLVDSSISVETIPGAGHVMMTEQPAAFAAAILRALRDGSLPRDMA